MRMGAVLWVNLRSNPSICWRDWGKIMKMLSQESWSPCWDSNPSTWWMQVTNVIVTEPVCSVTDVQNNLYMTWGFHHAINDVFVIPQRYAALISKSLPMLQDSVIGPEVSVSNHEWMCNIQEEERPHNNFFLRHPTKHTFDYVSQFDGPWYRIAVQILCWKVLGLRLAKSITQFSVCLSLPARLLSVGNDGPWHSQNAPGHLCQSHTYHDLRQTPTQCNSHLKYWLYHGHSMCSPRTLLHCDSALQIGTLHVKKFTSRQQLETKQWQCCFKGHLALDSTVDRHWL